MLTEQKNLNKSSKLDLGNKLTKDIPDEKQVAINLFENFIPQVENDWELKEVRYKEVYEIVSKLKPSKSRGDNEVTNLLLREIPQIMMLSIMHLSIC